MDIFQSDLLDKFGTNMNQQAALGKFDPVVHRDLEIRNVLEILARKNKNNPILVGKPGVGKTAIIEGLAGIFVENNLPQVLRNKVIYSIPIGDLVAGTSYRGEFEERMNLIITELKVNRNIILFIDEIHNAIGTGSVKGGLDIANILKPAISRGEVQLIGATTEDEFDRFIRSDKAFERRLQKVHVHEPDQITSILMLRGLRERFEKHHQMRIKDSAITTAVTLASKFIAERYLPDKALDLLDLAASSLRINKEATPIALIQLNQDISRIEVELSLLDNEEADTTSRRELLLDDLSNMVAISKEREQKWLEGKELSSKIEKLTKLIGSYSKEADENKRIGYESKYEEISNVLIPKIQEDLALLQKRAIDFDTILLPNELCEQDILDTFNKYHSPNQTNSFKNR